MLTLVAAVFLAAAARAQTPAVVRIVFRVFALEPIPALHYSPKPNAPLVELRWPSSEASREFEYMGPAELALLRRGEGFAPVAQFHVPLECRRAWLILTPSADSERVGGLLLPITAADQSSPILRCINVSGRAVVVESGADRQELPPSTSGVLARAEAEPLRILVQTRGQWRRVSQLEVEAPGGAAVAVVLFPPFRDGELQPQVRVIYDRAE